MSRRRHALRGTRVPRPRPKLAPVDELAAALADLDTCAAATKAAYDRFTATWADGELAAWERLHEAQNAAARRLHAANRALGRSPTDTSPLEVRP